MEGMIYTKFLLDFTELKFHRISLDQFFTVASYNFIIISSYNMEWFVCLF